MVRWGSGAVRCAPRRWIRSPVASAAHLRCDNTERRSCLAPREGTSQSHTYQPYEEDGRLDLLVDNFGTHRQLPRMARQPARCKDGATPDPEATPASQTRRLTGRCGGSRPVPAGPRGQFKSHLRVSAGQRHLTSGVSSGCVDVWCREVSVWVWSDELAARFPAIRPLVGRRDVPLIAYAVEGESDLETLAREVLAAPTRSQTGEDQGRRVTVAAER